MANKKTKLKTFRISAKIIIMTEVEISAETFEEALAYTKGMDVDDFVSFKGDHLDSEFGIQGISAYPNAFNPKDNATV
jgi:hypothetical protein